VAVSKPNATPISYATLQEVSTDLFALSRTVAQRNVADEVSTWITYEGPWTRYSVVRQVRKNHLCPRNYRSNILPNSLVGSCIEARGGRDHLTILNPSSRRIPT
jgi:hypothetical protein